MAMAIHVVDSTGQLFENMARGKFMRKENVFKSVPIKLGEIPIEDIPQKVQLMRTCTFFHKQYGKVDITRQLFSEMIQNFEKSVRGIDLMIDYSHDSDREAAGWIKGLEIVENIELGEDELWAVVEWTPKGRKTLADKEFAYLSADFDPDYRDNEKPNERFGAVLLGAGLTNRPVIKRMKPAVQLSEFSEYETNKGELMENEIEDKTKMSEMEKKLSDSQAKLAEIDSLMQELGVSSIEELMNSIREMRKENVELAEEKDKQEKGSKLNILLSDGKISQAQKVEALKLEKSSFESFIKLAEMNEKVVKLAETGSTHSPKEGDDNEDVEEKVIELAETKMKEEKIDFAKAVSFVLSENKELAKKYYASKSE